MEKRKGLKAAGSRYQERRRTAALEKQKAARNDALDRARKLALQGSTECEDGGDPASEVQDVAI
jgi:hypothetical protein